MNLSWRVVGVTLLVALAGCGAVSPGDGDATRTTVETTVDGDPSAEQAVDAFDLAEAHRDALANDSFTVTATTTVQHANGTAPLRQFVRTHVDPATDTVLSRQTVDGSDPGRFGVPVAGVVELWTNESTSLGQRTYENGTTKAIERPQDGVVNVEQLTRWEDLALLLSAGDARSVDGDRATGLVVATGSENTELAYGEPDQLTVTVRLSDVEYVESYTVSYETTRAGTPVQVTRTVHFTSVGETAVERPAWVSDAQNSSS